MFSLAKSWAKMALACVSIDAHIVLFFYVYRVIPWLHWELELKASTK